MKTLSGPPSTEILGHENGMVVVRHLDYLDRPKQPAPAPAKAQVPASRVPASRIDWKKLGECADRVGALLDSRSNARLDARSNLPPEIAELTDEEIQTLLGLASSPLVQSMLLEHEADELRPASALQP